MVKIERTSIRVLMSDVCLVEKMHSKPIKLDQHILELIDKGKYNTSRIILPVRKLSDERYALLSNRRGYEIVKYAKNESVTVQVFDCRNRLDFLQEENRYTPIAMSRIKINHFMKNSTPNDYKVEREIECYKQNGRFTKPIFVTQLGSGNKFLLVNGYSRYFSATVLGLDIVPVIEV